MSDGGIKSPNIPLGISLGEFIGHEIVGGTRSTRRYPRDQVLGSLDALTAGVQAGGGITFSTLAQASANLNYAPNQMAWVVLDDTTANNGVYQKVGNSGSGYWLRQADLPYSFYVADNDGAGTANAIQATSAKPIPAEKALVVFNVTAANTSSTVTVAFNSGVALTIKTSSDNLPAIGGFIPNMLLAGYIHGSEFRLLTDQASAAIQTAAESAQTAAAASAAAALTSKNEAAAITGSGSVDFGAGPVSVQTVLEPIKNLADCFVATRSAMAALDTTKSSAAVVHGEGSKNGTFFLHAYTDYSADVTADVREGYVVRSTFDTDYVWVRDVTDGRYMIDWFVTAGASKLVNTNEVKDALQSIPSGGTAVFTCLKQYSLFEISATTRGHIKIDGNGAGIINTSQATGPIGTGLPILRIFVRTRDYDVSIYDLLIQGPRLTTDTTVGIGSYGGDPLNPGTGMPSGIDIPIGRTVSIKRCIVNGTYYNGVEVHYALNLVAEENNVSNHGYAGILFTNTRVFNILKNTVADIGSVSPTDGYGISAGTSYNAPDYTELTNGDGIIAFNDVSFCKRKCLDVHAGQSVSVVDNNCRGAGYAFVYAVCEGKDKLVTNVIIARNKLYGVSSFLSGVTSSGVIVVGSFSGDLVSGDVVADHTNFAIRENLIQGVLSPFGVTATSNDNSGKETQTLSIDDNDMLQSTFDINAIGFNPYSQRFGLVTASRNKIYCNLNNVGDPGSQPFINIKFATRAIASENICDGTGSNGSAVLFEDVVASYKAANFHNGTLQDV